MLFIKKIKGLKCHMVSLENIRTPFGEPFDNNNHWVKTLKEYDLGLRDFTKSSLYNFHKTFQPNNIFDVMPNIEMHDKSFFLGEYPWGRWSQKSTKKEWFQGTHCGPTHDEIIEKEWNNFLILYNNIMLKGLRIREYGHPLGCFLIDEDAKKYFLVLGGNHRMAIISHLKLLKKIPVRAIARNNIEQFCYYNNLKINFPRDDLNIAKSRKLFKCLISPEFITNDI